MKLALTGGARRTLLPLQRSYLGIVADAQDVYCADLADGAILRVGVDGGGASLFPVGDKPLYLALDQTHIYFTTDGGAVMSLAKP
jgi:hypothetical protein